MPKSPHLVSIGLPSLPVGRLDCVAGISRLNRQTIELIQNEYRRSTHPWYLGFSGGKDSSALLTLAFNALLGFGNSRSPVTVVYCDTGVDIPMVSALVRRTLRRLKRECLENEVPFRIRIARPRLMDRYFVKVIGRGYPPPTNKFRWCTDRLRIGPVKRAMRLPTGSRSVVLLGVRRGESVKRDRTIRRHAGSEAYRLQQSGEPNIDIFAPIVLYTHEQVWATIQENPIPNSIDAHRLTSLYRDAAGECPIIRDPRGTPCGKGRFGCWTCTVIRRDRAMQSMVQEGHQDLAPLLEWRNWLAVFRDDSRARCRVRRNGQRGLGPFTLSARRELLRRLLITQRKVPWQLISRQEVVAIRSLWREDEGSDSYSE